ncbi:MAG: spore coat protein CotJB [Ruminococcaceae bacterium]|nr:spore coat protein CotJB [Oscillospiraceae bacterium]
MTKDRSTLLHRIQAEDFVLYEVALYLDGHPTCKKALRYYHEHKKIAAMLKAEFEEKFGPLSIYHNHSEQNWDWACGPWPWEKEAN